MTKTVRWSHRMLVKDWEELGLGFAKAHSVPGSAATRISATMYTFTRQPPSGTCAACGSERQNSLTGLRLYRESVLGVRLRHT